MPLNISSTRQRLQTFDFAPLFIEDLGWEPPANRKIEKGKVKDLAYSLKPIARLSGIGVFEITADGDAIPDAKTRAAIHKQVSELCFENLLIFTDTARSQSLWYWVKRESGKIRPRDHLYVKGQPGDLFLSKLSAMVVDISELDADGNITVIEVADRLKRALDIEQVTKKFYGEFKDQHLAFLDLIQGIDDDRDRHWYASVLLNRLMFIYFLQRKFFLDNRNDHYLQHKLDQSRAAGKDQFYEKFLKILFFDGFAKPEESRSAAVNALLGKIKYLNGGLFLHHRIELDWPAIKVPDKAFANLFSLFERYSWNLNDTPGGEDNEINPDVLGYIFEKYINQKAFGAYYTRPEITEYLCERTIHQLILDGVAKGEGKATRAFDNMGDLLLALDAPLCRKLLYQVLPDLRLLDPACGSAAFLVSAMKTLINIYAAVIGKIEFLNDQGLRDWLRKTQKEHKSVSYFIKRSIITNNLFGVDIMEEAIEIAKLRLFLALVASANKVDDLEPLPNIEFNIMPGNSLIGLLHVDPAKFDELSAPGFEQKRMVLVHEPGAGDLGFTVESAPAKTRKEKEREYAARLQGQRFAALLVEKNELVALYRRATGFGEDLQDLRDGIEKKKTAAKTMLNRLLLDQFKTLEIQYQQATWDDEKNHEGKPERRTLKLADIVTLKPFHWGYEFDQVIVEHGGFDAIITNPPWEIFKPNSKEFLEEYSELVSKKKMTIKEFEKEQAKQFKEQPEIRAAWLKYESEYPHVSAFYRSAPQYRNQISIVDGKKAGSDINLYKLFTEQCCNLLRPNGYCGIVIPSGIYTDLGAKQLRQMLFNQTTVTGLFCIENRKEVFEGVHRSFKFVVLTFAKGGCTNSFPAAFMRLDVAELEQFPREGAIEISTETIRRLSPSALAVIELTTAMDVRVIEKLARFPRLSECKPATWQFTLGNEFHMTGDSRLFKNDKGNGRLPLFEGKMIHQFHCTLAEPRYWIKETEGRKTLLGREEDVGQQLPYQGYRLAHRSIARSTDERTMLCTILPPNTFYGHSINATRNPLSSDTVLYLTGVLNSFAFDFALRTMVSANLTMFFIYQMWVPRPARTETEFKAIVSRAAQLICTTPQFDDLSKKVFGDTVSSQDVGVTDRVERAKLRSELDGLVAHLYGLTEDEFAYILTTFPLVPDPVKIAAHNAYRNVAKGLIT